MSGALDAASMGVASKWPAQEASKSGALDAASIAWPPKGLRREALMRGALDAAFAIRQRRGRHQRWRVPYPPTLSCSAEKEKVPQLRINVRSGCGPHRMVSRWQHRGPQ